MTLTIADVIGAQARHDGTMANPDGPRAGQPKRRTFTTAYKRRIIEEYENAGQGERGALLRREGLYTSHISDWRRSLATPPQGSVSPRKPGRPEKDPAAAENERLRKENEKLAAELARTKAALEVVGKAHALLELLSESADSEKKHRK